MALPLSADLQPLDCIFELEKSAPNQVYLTQPMGGGVERDYTWGKVADEARRMAAFLRSYGWEPGSRVAILSKNCAWWFISDYAIWMAGFVSVPLYPTLAADTVREILEHCEARGCFVGKLDDWDRMRPGIPASVRCISFPLSPPNDYPAWQTIMKETEPLQGAISRPADDLATIVYTSGTTGRAKGVMHSFGTLAWGRRAIAARFPPGPDARVLSYLPLSHIGERVLGQMLSLGGTTRVHFIESLDTFAGDIRRTQPTHFFSVPRLWVKFQQALLAKIPQTRLDRLLAVPILAGIVKRRILKGLGLARCRIAASAAAPLPPELVTWYGRLGLDIIEGYGMTENAAVSHSTLPGHPRPGSVGLPYDGVEARIDTDTGELQMRSPGIMLGYYKDAALTAATVTIDGWLCTGDKAEIGPDGHLRITGRIKDDFKTSKGKYVSPAPIEQALAVLPGVEACCVVGANLHQPFGLLSMSPEVVQTTARSPAVRKEMSIALRGRLAEINRSLDPHERLGFLVLLDDQWTIDSGTVTPTLKIRRDRIEERYADRFDAWAGRHEEVVWEVAWQADLQGDTV